jgi:OsmC subfamily peroxiredoxin
VVRGRVEHALSLSTGLAFIRPLTKQEPHHDRKTASVQWEGRGKQALGKISTETGALKDYPYGFASRFEDDRRGTNPEELLGAAHAACFTMAFSFARDKAGLATAAVNTRASVRPCRNRAKASSSTASP